MIKNYKLRNSTPKEKCQQLQRGQVGWQGGNFKDIDSRIESL